MSKRGRILNYYTNHFLQFRVKAQFREAFNRQLAAVETDAKSFIPICETSPVIILGMHRSGTTLMSNLLREAGLFMGWLRGDDTDESLFFQTVNRAMLSLADSSWDRPESFIQARQDEAFVDRLSGVAYNYCEKPAKTIAYRGPKGRRPRSFFSQSVMWGWKDPRTCITLPVWLKLFPDTKVLFMHRNGLDVANSLFVRNKKYINNKAYSDRCKDIGGAFELWEIYNEQCLSNISELDEPNLLQIGYEDLLSSPEETMIKVLDFVNLSPTEGGLKKMLANIDSRRGHAFMSHPVLTSLYHEIKDKPMMKRLGYSNVLIP